MPLPPARAGAAVLARRRDRWKGALTAESRSLPPSSSTSFRRSWTRRQATRRPAGGQHALAVLGRCSDGARTILWRYSGRALGPGVAVCKSCSGGAVLDMCAAMLADVPCLTVEGARPPLTPRGRPAIKIARPSCFSAVVQQLSAAAVLAVAALAAACCCQAALSSGRAAFALWPPHGCLHGTVE